MSNKVFIIAEAGVNHNGSIELAKKLIDVAVEAKVDAVKFQTFKAENLVSKNAQKADYQKETTNKEESQFDMIKKLELDVDTHKELISYCKSKNIMFLSTPFDHDSIELLNDLGLEIFKIPRNNVNVIDDPIMKLERYKQLKYKDEIVKITELISEESDPYIVSSLEKKLNIVCSKLSLNNEEKISVEQLIAEANEKRKDIINRSKRNSGIKQNRFSTNIFEYL